jgi:predicted nucleotidyltransferase
MKSAALTARELELLAQGFVAHPNIEGVTLYGSRAKGTHAPYSDVDLALRGNVAPVEAEAPPRCSTTCRFRTASTSGR